MKVVGTTWAEINLDNLKENMNNIKRITGEDVMLCGVVKANAYGHGSKIIAEYLEKEKLVDYLSVARLEEAIELRNHGIKLPILCLGYIENEALGNAIDRDIAVTVYSKYVAEELNQLSEIYEKKADVHIKLDTGMSRLGFKVTEQSVEDICDICKFKNLNVEGIYTHFASADEADKSDTRAQVVGFNYMVDRLKEEGVEFKIKHVSNSAAILDMDELNLNLVRCGIIMYGHYPSDEVSIDRIKLKPLMTLKTKISNIKEVNSGVGVSYGYKYKTSEVETIVTLPVGYADGYSRMQKTPEVTIRGQQFDVIGRICMDQCMVRIDKDIELCVGEEVIIYGEGGVSVEEIASDLGTINYEVLCMLARRVTKVYLEKNDIYKAVNYVLG